MIIVTGGCGYIGSHIVKRLTEAGEKVVVFDNLTHGSKIALLHDEELVVGDICDSNALRQVFKTHQITEVIHLAALVNAAESNEKAAEYQMVNAAGSKNVWQVGLEFGVKHFLYASSAAVYGTPNDRSPIPETAPTLPTNPYGETKLAGERSLVELIKPPANYLSFRFFNVGGAEPEGRLGQSRESRAIMQRLFAVANGEDNKIIISGHDYDTPDGTVVRDFVHVEDIAQAFVIGLAYLRQGGNSQILNLGAGEPHTIGEVYQIVQEVTGKDIPVEYRPRIPGDISFSLSDISQAQKILSWKPTHSLHEIVKDGWNSYVKRNS